MVIGLVDSIPYAVLVLIGSINSLDESLEHCARPRRDTVADSLEVTLLSFPGILAALVLAFSQRELSADALILGGSKVQTLSAPGLQLHAPRAEPIRLPGVDRHLLVAVFDVNHGWPAVRSGRGIRWPARTIARSTRSVGFLPRSSWSSDFWSWSLRSSYDRSVVWKTLGFPPSELTL